MRRLEAPFVFPAKGWRPARWTCCRLDIPPSCRLPSARSSSMPPPEWPWPLVRPGTHRRVSGLQGRRGCLAPSPPCQSPTFGGRYSSARKSGDDLSTRFDPPLDEFDSGCCSVGRWSTTLTRGSSLWAFDLVPSRGQDRSGHFGDQKDCPHDASGAPRPGGIGHPHPAPYRRTYRMGVPCRSLTASSPRRMERRLIFAFRNQMGTVE